MKINRENLRTAMTMLQMATSKDKNKPFATSLIELSTHEGYLYGYTYNTRIHLRYKICPVTEEFNTTVAFDFLDGLLKSSNCDEIDLTKDHDKNGAEFARFRSSTLNCKMPTYDNTVAHVKTGKKDAVKTVVTNEDFTTYCDMNMIKKVLNQHSQVACYQNIYFGDVVMVTDCTLAVIAKKRIFNDDVLLNYKTVEILTKLGDFEYTLEKDANFNISHLYVTTSDIAMYVITEDTTRYQAQDLMTLFTKNIPDMVTLERSNVSSCISASSLFPTESMVLTFNELGVFVCIATYDFKYRLSETPCTTKKSYKINIDILKKLLIHDIINMYYGEDRMLQVKGSIFEEVIGCESVG